ncbi:MAG: histidine phosphatase family protein [Proteobacteria bacterium]|nr:histidine phosphatase family protein [Pseudomonadota bacterium]HQR04920.1 histidine phosphatase family protein [Rhodocyclaceae bacterium]
MSATRFCIVRHGETAWNAARRMQGHLDIPLNATGHAQARAVARHLAGEAFDAVLSSDLARAMATATPVARALGIEARPEPRLRERHYGVMQGLTHDEVMMHFPADGPRIRMRDPAYDFRGGETLPDFAGRITAVVDEAARAHPGGRVLLVCHGGVLDVFYRKALGRGLSGPRDFPIPNAGINRLEVAGGRWRLVEWAYCGHLEESLDEVPG